MIVIWQARQTIAVSLYMMKISTIGISIGPRKNFHVFIYTYKGCTLVIFIIRHDVAIVFSGPGGWAAVLGWEEEDCRPCSHMTHCTRNIVVMMTLKWMLVFNSMELRMISYASVFQV